MSRALDLGIDVGSTTVKVVYLDQESNIIYSRYERHFSEVKNTLERILKESMQVVGNAEVKTTITGSGAMGIANILGIKFVQEVIACTEAVERYIKNVDVAIELGGEDSKITYFGKSLEQRMNSSCAGGTGAFIDQMATLLQTDATGLNEYAKSYKVLYPIAARCGVFAKTDVQPLINEGVAKEDISASIFQAVVNQTISVLACGKPIKGKVAFLGGPLHFLSELRKRFIETLHLTDDEIIIPEKPELFVAIGAALIANKEQAKSLQDIIDGLAGISNDFGKRIALEPLFKDEAELDDFKARHDKDKVAEVSLESYKGNTYLGIDAGSTTTKLTLTGDNDELLYSFYGSNKGDPLNIVETELLNLYDKLPEGVNIVSSCVTGYGENLIKNTFKVKYGEVETIAHYKGARAFAKDVGFILDIGGQDMKCIQVEDGIVKSVTLNEACSSGCGSFIEMLSNSLKMSVSDFSKEALLSPAPVDLGTRCTVFMNSKIKEAQKEGVSIGDISAGLSYSVIKNALFKVIKLKDTSSIKGSIVVQGGTFYNEAVLRAMEKIIADRPIVRPNIAGLMGAYGSSIIAREKYEAEKEVHELLGADELKNLEIKKTPTRCGGCENNCLLTINKLSDGRRYIYGNRCEKPLGKEAAGNNNIPNLFDYEYEKVFDRESLPVAEAKRGVIGIPRVLNMYENYPFWHTIFTKLGYRVEISERSSKEIYEKGISSIPSESACYPAKLVHGHIEDLIEKGIKTIFYPCVIYEKTEDERINNHYNCPVVGSYPEVIKNNVESIKEKGIRYLNPFFDFDRQDATINMIYKTFASDGVTKEEVRAAVLAGYEEQEAVKRDIEAKGEETLKYIEDNNITGIVVSGRPYHLDPEINHGLTKLITNQNMAVLTEKSVAHLAKTPQHLRVLDQWVYHNRLYRAAAYVASNPRLELMQITSFGCGLDAITEEQVQEILATKGKIYTLIKIDEGSNLGAINIRVRSLKAAIEERRRLTFKPKEVPLDDAKIMFTKEMRADYTILFPDMAPIQFEFVETALNQAGYNVEFLGDVVQEDVDEGLKYVNNDACYPAIIVIGKFLTALKSGKYDLNKTVLAISQTGGGCRASNYIGLIRKALKDNGLGHIPVLSVSVQGLENHPGIKITPGLIKRALMAVLYGDLMMTVLFRTRPYEIEKGSANAMYEKWAKVAKENIKNGSWSKFKQIIPKIVYDFDHLSLTDEIKPRVGIVGEILVKFQPFANNFIVDTIEEEGGEAVMPGLLDFLYYCMHNMHFKYENYGTSKWGMIGSDIAKKYFDMRRKPIADALRSSKRFDAPHNISKLAEDVEDILSLGNQTGEGWFLTAEIIGLIKDGASNVACLQPFGCLPNHVISKGVLKAVREKYPEANLAAIDYDPGISHVNQLNRIKLMMAAAHKNLEERFKEQAPITPSYVVDTAQGEAAATIIK